MKKMKLGREKLDEENKKHPIRFFLEKKIIDSHGGVANCKTKAKNHLTKTQPK